MIALFLTSFLIFLASLAGAMAGIGGGVIIKPVLDFLHFYDVREISFISTCAVFAMSVSSIYKHIKGKTQFDKKHAIFIATGSVFGGHFGESLFQLLRQAVGNAGMITALQNFILLTLLVMTVIYTSLLATKIQYKVSNVIVLLIIGIFLGICGSFLGIGGGPINIAILMMFLSVTAKQAAAYSIMTIFFSQLSKLISMGAEGEFHGMPFHVLIPVIPLAIVGGILGTWLNKKYSARTIQRFFTSVTIFIILLNIINIAISLAK